MQNDAIRREFCGSIQVLYGDGYSCFHWASCCRMVHSNLNSVQEAVVLVEASGHAAYR